MTTRINVNLSGFDSSSLKTIAEATIASNRNKQTEKERLDKSTQEGIVEKIEKDKEKESLNAVEFYKSKKKKSPVDDLANSRFLSKKCHNAVFMEIFNFNGTYPKLTDGYTKFYMLSGNRKKSIEITIPKYLLPTPKSSSFFRRGSGSNQDTYPGYGLINSQLYDYKIFPIDKKSAIIAIGYTVASLSYDFPNSDPVTGVNTTIREEPTYALYNDEWILITPSQYLDYKSWGPPTLLTSKDSKVYCIYVSYTDIRIINTPPKIANLFKYTIPQPTLVTTKKTKTDFNGLHFIGFNEYNNPTYEPYTYEWTEIDFNLGPVTRPYTNNSFYEDYFAKFQFSDVSAGGFEGNTSVRMVGPGIYKYTQNQKKADEFVESCLGNVWLRSFVYNYINSPIPFQKSYDISTLDPTFRTLLEYKGPKLNAQSSFNYPPIPIGNDRYKESPAWKKYAFNGNMPQPPYSRYFKELTEQQLESGDYEIEVKVFFYWDWGKPDYCYSQLVSLGFSPADLQ
jgi:hypothetical protein